MSQQWDYPGPNDTAIYDVTGNVIAMVPAAFAADVCIEGSGALTDGRRINFAANCQYGPACATSGSPTCYEVLDPSVYPWGKGGTGIPLVPFRSIATSPGTIPTGSCIYVPAWNGLQIPAVGGLGGFTHDGYFSADDTGGWINGSHIDIFCGTHAMNQAMERIFPTSYSGGSNGTCTATFQASIVDCSQVPALPGSGGGIFGVSTGRAIAEAAAVGAAIAGGLWWWLRRRSGG